MINNVLRIVAGRCGRMMPRNGLIESVLLIAIVRGASLRGTIYGVFVVVGETVLKVDK